jgi:hypothetical protein
MWTRSDLPHPSLETLEPSYEALLTRLDRAGREGKAIIVDFCTGPPPRNDDDFERATRPYRLRLFEGFVAGGVLVKTASGKMQLTRTSREDSGLYVVASDVDELKAHLDARLDEAGIERARDFDEP